MAAESTTNRSLGWTLGLTSVAFFMVALDALVVITALPAMQRELGASLPTLQWTVNAYGITFAAGIITAAALGDRLGRRRVFALRLGRLRPRADGVRADRGSDGAGLGRRLRLAAEPDDLDGGLSRRAARRDRRHLGRDRRPRRRQRTADRRRRHRGGPLAAELLGEHSHPAHRNR